MLLAITALAVFTFTAAAQDKAADGALDSAFVGKSIFSLLPSKAKGDPADVKVHQSQAILESFNSHISSNSSKGISGFRIRIFNDNQQSARVSSEFLPTVPIRTPTSRSSPETSGPSPKP